MLVLLRKRGESLLIGNDIEIKVLSISSDGKSVRLGISAPKLVRILRNEVAEREGSDADVRSARN